MAQSNEISPPITDFGPLEEGLQRRNELIASIKYLLSCSDNDGNVRLQDDDIHKAVIVAEATDSDLLDLAISGSIMQSAPKDAGVNPNQRIQIGFTNAGESVGILRRGFEKMDNELFMQTYEQLARLREAIREFLSINPEKEKFN